MYTWLAYSVAHTQRREQLAARLQVGLDCFGVQAFLVEGLVEKSKGRHLAAGVDCAG